MTSKTVFSRYEDLLKQQIARLRRDFNPDGEMTDYQENTSSVLGHDAVSPRDLAISQLQHRSYPEGSHHFTRHFDDFNRRPDVETDLSPQQAGSISTPCQTSNAFDRLPYTETTLHGSLFGAWEHLDGGPTSFARQKESDMTAGLFTGTGLNRDRQTHGDTKGPEICVTTDNRMLQRELLETRRDKLTEWHRDVRRLREDVQDFTLSSVGKAERQKILDSIRSRFVRLRKDLHTLIKYSKEIGAERYFKDKSEHTDRNVPLCPESCDILRKPDFRDQNILPKFELSTKEHFISADQDTKLTEKPPKERCNFDTINHKDLDKFEYLYGEPVKKIKAHEENIYKGIQRIQEIRKDQEMRGKTQFSEIISGKSNTQGSPLDVQSRATASEKPGALTEQGHLRTCKPELNTLEDNLNDNTVSTQATDFAAEVRKEIKHRRQQEKGSKQKSENLQNVHFTKPKHETWCRGPRRRNCEVFLGFMLLVASAVLFLISKTTLETCNVDLAKQMAANNQFIEVSWSDGIPPT